MIVGASNILYSHNLYTLTEVACHIGRPPRPRDRVVVVTTLAGSASWVLTSLELIVILPTAAHRSAAVAVPCARGGRVILTVNGKSPGQVIVGAVTSCTVITCTHSLEVACHIGRPPRPRDRGVVVVTYIGRIGILGAYITRADRYIAYRGTQISRRRSPGARGGRVILTVYGNISRAGDRRRRNILYRITSTHSLKLPATSVARQVRVIV